MFRSACLSFVLALVSSTSCGDEESLVQRLRRWNPSELGACDPDDMACEASHAACTLATKIQQSWPVQDYDVLAWIWDSLQSLCQHGTLDPNYPKPPEEFVEDSLAQSSKVKSGQPPFPCAPAEECAPDVIDYTSSNKAAEYGLKAGETAAQTALNALEDVLEANEMLSLPGTIAFSLLGNVLGNFFPSAGGLPENPCTYATSDWGKCVWEQIRPFVAKFVAAEIDGAFEDLWTASIEGFQSRLWELNDTAYFDSTHYPNGKIKSMSNKTRDEMYDSIYGVYQDMIGSIPLFLTNHAINTTGGAYISQFASLHTSIMATLMGSLKYRSKGHRHGYQTLHICYGTHVFDRATEAFTARMAAIKEHYHDDGVRKCCGYGGMCNDCHEESATYDDSWRDCSWHLDGWETGCASFGSCLTNPSFFAPVQAKDCFQDHVSYVKQQTVLFWQSWLLPIPLWINNAIKMQKIQASPSEETGEPQDTPMACQAFGVKHVKHHL